MLAPQAGGGMEEATNDKRVRTIILAAGKGTRMRSDLAKVLHPVCGKPMLQYSIVLARAIGSERIIPVVGHQAERIRETFRDPDLFFVEQTRPLGTGHAVLQAREAIRGYTGRVVILCGDVPCLRSETVQELLRRHRKTGACVTVLTVVLDDPGGYGRIVKTPDGRVRRIVEARDAAAEELRLREINTGVYCVEGPFLFDAVAEIGNDNAQREYYLTDIVEIAFRKGCPVEAFAVPDPAEVMGVNTRDDLARACRIMAGR